MSQQSQNEGPDPFTVRMAEMAVSHDPEVSLRTLPLGACLAISIYDPIAKVGGLLHTLLPSSELDPERAAKRPAMFLDTGLAALFQRAQQLNARRENLQTCVAGASQILDQSNLFNVGQRNYNRLTELLAEHGVPIHAQDVGGRTDCAMELIIGTGEVRIKYCGKSAQRTLCKPSMTT